MCTEQSYAYRAENGICQGSSCSVGVPKGGVVGFKDVTIDDEEALMDAVAQQPVSVAIEADLMAFQLYRSGVLSSIAAPTWITASFWLAMASTVSVTRSSGASRTPGAQAGESKDSVDCSEARQDPVSVASRRVHPTPWSRVLLDRLPARRPLPRRRPALRPRLVRHRRHRAITGSPPARVMRSRLPCRVARVWFAHRPARIGRALMTSRNSQSLSPFACCGTSRAKSTADFPAFLTWCALKAQFAPTPPSPRKAGLASRVSARTHHLSARTASPQ